MTKFQLFVSFSEGTLLNFPRTPGNIIFPPEFGPTIRGRVVAMGLESGNVGSKRSTCFNVTVQDENYVTRTIYVKTLD